MKIYDNQGKTFDRYTVIFPNNDIFAMSCNPGSPQGVCMYCGTQIDISYLKSHNARIAIRNLPNQVQAYIRAAKISEEL